MPNIFPKWANHVPLKAAVAMGLMTASAVAGVTYYFTQEYTRAGYMPIQPAPFSHKLHVGDLGMDCRYCHNAVEVSAHSNIPTTESCMACHTQIRPDSPKLAPVRESWQSGLPIEWVRIHKAPDYVYFNHAVHVARGVSCVSCHGPVDLMEEVWQDKSQSMSWCLDCHRAPESALRPLQEVYQMDWTAGAGQQELGKKLKEAWEVQPSTNCGACHR